LEKLSNKQIRDIFIQTQFKKPYIHNFWIQKFKNNVNWENFYYFLNYSLMDTRITQYRYTIQCKLLHIIIATNENLFTWKLSNSPCCNFCNEIETVDHFVIECKCLDNCWTRISYVFKSCGVSKQVISLQYLVIGYKSELSLSMLHTGECIYSIRQLIGS